MSAYAATVTALMKRAVKVDQVTGIGMYVGKCDVTNYNTTLAEITAITGKFRNLMQVICTTISDNGYMIRWDAVANAFKAYYPTPAAATHVHAFIVGAGTIGTNMEIGVDLNTDSGKIEGAAGITAERTLLANTPIDAGGAVTATAALEVATDVDVGVVEFVAYGLI